MYSDSAEERTYIKENLADISSSRIDDTHWDLFCESCEIVRGFNVTRQRYTTTNTAYQNDMDLEAVRTAYIECPVCSGYKVITYYQLGYGNDASYYLIAEMPDSKVAAGDVLPAEPRALRKAYKEAIKSMNAGAYIAAASMFRRALQVITRDIGKATKGTLASELSQLVGKKFNGVTFTQDFSDIGYIIKEAGNQAAHPDDDPDLLDFEQSDAEDLHQIFMGMVAELFVAPKAAEEAKKRFIQSRKIPNIQAQSSAGDSESTAPEV